MRRYDYRAKDKSTGKTVKGSIQADNERAAGKLLVSQGYIPDSVVEHGANNPVAKFTERIRTKDRIVFTRQFATLIGAGLPLSNSLRTVAEQTASKSMKAVVEEILASVEGGKSLNEAFSKRPDIFNGIYLALIKAGEMSGTLDVSLRRLADQEEKDDALMRKIRGAMVYPMIILAVIIAVLAFMMIAVVPQVGGLYRDLGEELPALTQFLVALTNFFMEFWWLTAILFFGGIGLLVNFFRNTKTGRHALDSFKLRVPIFSDLFKKLYVSRFARTAEMMLSTGVPMLDSITIAVDATSNLVTQEEFGKALAVLKGGKPLSDAIKDREYMLPLVPQMASIGEESGKIDEMLGKAAQVYENELEEQINNISTMIEPILMLVMSVLIGVVIGGTLLPIYSLVSKIR